MHAALMIAVALVGSAEAQTTIAVEEWAEVYNSPCDTYDTGRDIALDSAANVYVVAFHGCSAERSAVIKYDTNGVHQWTAFTDFALSAIAVDASDNVYVTGGGPDLITRKYTAAGVVVWTNTYDTPVAPGDPHIEAGLRIATSGGSVYVTGEARTRPTDGIYDQDNDFLTIKYNATTGARDWERHLNRLSGLNNLNDSPEDIVVDASGNVVVTGQSGTGTFYSGSAYLTVKYNTSGTLVWSATYVSPLCCTNPNFSHAYAVDVDSSGDVYVTGQSGPAPGFYDIATVKYASASGTELWAARFDAGTCRDEGRDLAVDAADNVYVGGQSQGGCGGYIAIKYDSAGNELWVSSYSLEDAGENLEALTVDTAGNVYLTGSSLNTSGGTSWDYATVAFDAAGNDLWDIRYSGPGAFQQEIAFAIALDSAQNVYITGNSPDAMDVTDVVTVKYRQEECTPEICDGLDNDCNGMVDDGIADLQTGTDVGECRIEIQSCIGGSFQIVQTGITPIPEICDGLDNDCNGTNDNGVADIQTGTDVGECQVEIQSCIGGTFTVVQTAIGPMSEMCDGLDNDCDGTNDNGIADLQSGTDVGACQVEIQSCIGGTFTIVQTGIGPSAEICDALDNDCNGVDDVTQGICNSPPSPDPTEFSDPSGNATVEFPDIAVGGDTTIQEIACSVNAPDGYTLLTEATCYEIESTADSSTGRKTVCIRFPNNLDPAPSALLKCESAGAQNCCAVGFNGITNTCTDGTQFLSLGVAPAPPPDELEICISVLTLSDYAFAGPENAGLDSDGDFEPDVSDNCPEDFNPLQEDEDEDGVGDLCDNCAFASNGVLGGTCTDGDLAQLGMGCSNDLDCGVGGLCSQGQQDGNVDAVGDACDPAIVPFFVSEVLETPACYFGAGCTPADFPVDWGALRSFRFGVPPAEPIYNGLLKGTWGGSVFTSSAPVDVYLEGVFVTRCVDTDPCWDPASTVDWNDGRGFLLSNLGIDFSDPATRALFEDGDAELSFVQNDVISVHVSNLELELFVVPEPSARAGLLVGGLGLLALCQRRARSRSREMEPVA